MIKLICVLGLIQGGVSLALAQTVPDAGALRQQFESTQPRRSQAPAPLQSPAPSEERPSLTGVRVAVQRFVFAGNTLISSAALEQAVQPYVSRTLDFAQLQSAATAVAKRYRRDGWVVRVFYRRKT